MASSPVASNNYNQSSVGNATTAPTSSQSFSNNTTTSTPDITITAQPTVQTLLHNSTETSNKDVSISFLWHNLLRICSCFAFYCHLKLHIIHSLRLSKKSFFGKSQFLWFTSFPENRQLSEHSLLRIAVVKSFRNFFRYHSKLPVQIRKNVWKRQDR